MSVSAEFENSILTVSGSFRRRMVPWSFFWAIFVEEKHAFSSYVLAFDEKFALLIIIIIIIIISSSSSSSSSICIRYAEKLSSSPPPSTCM